MHEVPFLFPFQNAHEVGGQVDPLALAGEDDVLVVQDISRNGNAALRGFGGFHAVGHEQQLPAGEKGHDDEQEREQVVHERTRKQNDDALPRLFVVERARVGHIRILALEGAEPAQRKGAHRKDLAVFLGIAKQPRPEAHGKFVDLEAEDLARDVMPELVHGDHDEQDEDRQQDAPDRAPDVRGGQKQKFHAFPLWRAAVPACQPNALQPRAR